MISSSTLVNSSEDTAKRFIRDTFIPMSGKRVRVATTNNIGGRDSTQIYVGVLESYDNYNNIVLSNCVEILRDENGESEDPVGAIMIRGNSVIFIGPIDTVLEAMS